MSFTDGTLATFMETELGRTGTALGLTAASPPIVSAVAWVASIIGAVASQTDDLKTMTIATWRAWVAAKSASANDKDLKAGPSALTMSQRFDHINNMLRDAEAAAMRYPEVSAMLGGAVPMPYAGGLSVADKAARESDADRVAPFFTRRLHEPIGVGEVG